MQNGLPHGSEQMTIERAIAAFLDSLMAKNRSSATIRAYHTDLVQFAGFLKETTVAASRPQDVSRADILDYPILAAGACQALPGHESCPPCASSSGFWRLRGQSANPRLQA